ncbi:uncharacterized protein V1516DRAFT_689067 [Lipomyces oligophaga]|uniref:uncharacterized protein n=1 Tax=Lipomyces oligophaga TaxID=45792 RepID=UPI0034CE8B68
MDQQMETDGSSSLVTLYSSVDSSSDDPATICEEIRTKVVEYLHNNGRKGRVDAHTGLIRRRNTSKLRKKNESDGAGEGDGENEEEDEVWLIDESDAQQVVEHMDPKIATGPWILALITIYGKGEKSAEFLEKSGQLFKSSYSDLQVKLVGPEFRALINLVATLSNSPGESVDSLSILFDAAMNFKAENKSLIRAHTVYLHQCLNNKQFRRAYELVSRCAWMTDFNSLYGLRYQDHLLYHYYAGVVCLGLEKFQEAFDFFQTVYCTPALGNVVSAVQIEAYKKMVLLSLINTGNVLGRLPMLAKESTSMICRSLARPYEFFALAFRNEKHDVLKHVWNNVVGYFTLDENLGLAEQAVVAYRKKGVRKLQKVFATVSIEYIKERDFLDLNIGPDTWGLIYEMIYKEDIYATLTRKNTEDRMILSFTQKALGASDLAFLRESLTRIQGINEQLVRSDRRIGMSREFLMGKSAANNTHSSVGGKLMNESAYLEGLSGVGASSWDTVMEDESFREESP